MLDHFVRTGLLLGKDVLEKIKKKKVMICGIGGVGSFAAEAIARCGVENLVLVDFDVVDNTNINRQLIALHSTVGKYKVDIMKERIEDINPDACVRVYKNKIDEVFLQETDFLEDLKTCDYIVEAIDDIRAKTALIKLVKSLNLEIISAMGAGNKLDATRFQVSDLFKTQVCPLAKIMRSRLKKEGITSLKVVYSQEMPVELNQEEVEDVKSQTSKKVIGSISFVPSAAGLIMAQETILDLAKG